MRINRHHFDLAIKLARSSKHPKTKVGAVLVADRRIIASCVNSADRSHPLQKYYNVNFRGIKSDNCRHLIHAEIGCLIKVRSTENFTNLRIYIARVLKNQNTLTMGRPCKACQQALRDFNITDIYYSTDGGYAYESLLSYEQGYERTN